MSNNIKIQKSGTDFFIQVFSLFLIFNMAFIVTEKQIYAAFEKTSETRSYRIDQKISSVTFTRKPVISDGSFSDFDGHLILKNGQLHKIEGSISVNSITIGDEEDDKEIRTTDTFFNRTRYPKINAKSVSIQKVDNQYNSIFDITIQGITQQFFIPFELITTNENSDRIRIKSHFKISLGNFDVPIGNSFGAKLCRFVVLRNASVKIDAEFYLEE